MRVFVTGATGFVGSAVVEDLLQAGHQVLGLARSDQAAATLTGLGAAVQRGSLLDIDSLVAGAKSCDGVIHTAFIHDFSNMPESAKADLAAIEAIGAALAGSGKPFVVTSAIGILQPGRLSVEGDAPMAGSAGSYRIPSELAALALGGQGVRASVVRLPPSVHGDGDHGFVPALIGIARKQGSSAYIGDGMTRWPAVHRRDAARLYRLALESGAAGSVYHATAQEGVATREIAAVIGRRLAVPVVGVSADRAAEHFGFMGRFFGMDCPASSEQTRRQLGWLPAHPGLLEDMDREAYFAAGPNP
ncbi:Nucleoside-diphosphate-sugar epimerase [Duganella sp. CF517]|uniref:SDR family oxidoreductase n=1 Tax=Duganella sp. CF517 TaxID=1881038 RepID=UPI0008BF3F46|nr:SDR family oxidoreductase [Duganella sp. CF517]SEO29485.1 Nucleoside-diphosphate-sugar epimerase [Duganella sp. CF517]